MTHDWTPVLNAITCSFFIIAVVYQIVGIENKDLRKLANVIFFLVMYLSWSMDNKLYLIKQLLKDLVTQ